MSQADSGNPPPEPDNPPGPSSIDWSEMVDDWVKYGREVLDRVAQRATANTAALKGKTYGRDQLIDDLEWFWDNAAKDVTSALEYIRTKFPTSS
jgi:hypothetical protein